MSDATISLITALAIAGFFLLEHLFNRYLLPRIKDKKAKAIALKIEGFINNIIQEFQNKKTQLSHEFNQRIAPIEAKLKTAPSDEIKQYIKNDLTDKSNEYTQAVKRLMDETNAKIKSLNANHEGVK